MKFYFLLMLVAAGATGWAADPGPDQCPTDLYG